RLGLGRRVEELVAQHHAREAQDVNLVADLRVRGIGERERGHVNGLELEQRQITTRHALARDGGTVLAHGGGEADSVREDDGDRRVQLDFRPRDGSRERLGRELPARLAHGPARLLVGNPRGCLAGRRHEVRVRDHPSARADEPAGPGLAERRRTDELLSASATGHDDFRADLCDDEGDGRLRAEQGFLHGDLGGRRGDRKEEEEEERARDPGTHRTNLIPRSDEKEGSRGVTPGAFGDASCFLLQHLHRGFGLRLRLSHLAGLARGLGLTDQLRGVAAMRRLNSLTGSLTATRGLNILAARSLRILTSRGLNILTTRSLHVLLATRSLGVLTAWSLGLLTTRGLNILTARSLRLLTPRRLHLLLALRRLLVLRARRLRVLRMRPLT